MITWRSGLLVATAVSLLLALAGSGGQLAEAALGDTDGDGFVDVGEEIAGSDPNDPASTPETREFTFLGGGSICGDAVDNDLDGLIDDDDPGCEDSDGDIISDPTELVLGSDPNDGLSFPEDGRFDLVFEAQISFIIGFFCSDGLDNDLDGLVDDDDPGCDSFDSDDDGYDDGQEKRFGSDPDDPASVPEHDDPNPGSCSDGIDNDLDGATDEADDSCSVPPNDDRADATVIDALPFADGPVVVKNATSEAGEPSCTGIPFKTIWYRYTPSDDTVVVAESHATGPLSTLSVWRASGTSLQQIACRSANEEGDATAAFPAQAGETYFFQVDFFPLFNPLPTVSFALDIGVQPENDNFEDATVIDALPFDDTVDTEAATTEFGEPQPSCGSSRAATVWYEFTPGDDTLVIASSQGSDYNTFIGVYTASIFGPAEVACNNNFSSAQSKVAFDAEANSTYYIQVGGHAFDSSGPGGDLVFSADVGVPPANDDFANAQEIASLPFSSESETLTATTEDGEPRPTCLPGSAVPETTLWFQHTPSEDTILVADTAGSEFFSAFIGIYQGASLDDLVEVGCAAPNFPAAVFGLIASAGETYYFQVGQTQSGLIEFEEGNERDDEPPTPAEEPVAEGHAFVSDLLVFNLDSLDFPSCPPAEFTISDPVGDTVGFGSFPQPDIISVSGGSDATTTCLTLDFAEPVPPPNSQFTGLGGIIDFDTDSDPNTGFFGETEYACSPSSNMRGVETQVYTRGIPGAVVPIFSSFGDFGEPSAGNYAIAMYEDTSVTFAIPLSALGGDDEFDFALGFGIGFSTSDCAPNGGSFQSPSPAPIGDASCDGTIDSGDAIVILHVYIELIDPMPCAYAADADGDGDTDPIDASLVLQFDVGIIGSLPP